MNSADAARDRLRSMALSLATGSGQIVDPRAFDTTLDEYRDALTAIPPSVTSDLETARATNQRLNYRTQQLESELAAYRRAVGRWEVSERGTYIPLSSLRTIGLAAGTEILGSVRHLRHFERVEQAETAIARGHRLALAFELGGNEFIADQIRTALHLAVPAAAPSASAETDLHVRPATVLAECDVIEADYRDRHDEVAVGARTAILRIRARLAVLEQDVPPSAPGDRPCGCEREVHEDDCDVYAELVLTAEPSAETPAEQIDSPTSLTALTRLVECWERMADHDDASVSHFEGPTAATLDATATARGSTYRHAAADVREVLRTGRVPQDLLAGGEPAVPSVPADTDLRERVARAARAVKLRLGPNAVAMAQRGEPIILNMSEGEAVADAVLAVLPAPADRAAVLREAADAVQQHGCLCQARLRRMADEAQQADPECSASISGNCLSESESDGPCDTDAGECVHGGQPADERTRP